MLNALLTQRVPVRLNGLGGDPQAIGLPPEHVAVHSFLGVPLVSRERVHGWLYLVDKLGSEPDPALAPFRGGTGSSIPVATKDAEPDVVKARTGDDAIADLSEGDASFRSYLKSMTKHSVPATAMKAREELASFDVKHGIA